MRNTKLKGVVVILTMTILFSACNKAGAQTGGGKSINSADDLKKYLDSQPANSKDKPIKVAIKLNEQMIANIRRVINDAGKYVSLDLSGSPLTSIPQSAFEDCGNLAGIIIPGSVTSIGKEAFYDCKNLTGVTFQGTIPSAKFAEYAFAGLGGGRDSLRNMYLRGGPGTYTRPNGTLDWKKQ